jgi:hypothetical protein
MFVNVQHPGESTSFWNAQGWGGVAKDPFGRWQPDYGALGGLRC